MESAKKIEKIQTPSKIKNSKDEIINTHTDEIVIALCGTIGSPLHRVAESLKKQLVNNFDYHCNIIRLSKFIEKSIDSDISRLKKFDRFNKLIEQGNKLRKKYGPSILAELCIHNIALNRIEINKEKIKKPNRICHIIDSIKNDEELNILRLVYGDLFYCIAISSSLTLREQELLTQEMTSGEIHQLFDRDSGEEFDHGQRVDKTFPQSDYFIRIDNESSTKLDDKIERFLDLIFNSKIITPNKYENAMYLAASSACNSSCLSRQVGAAVTDAEGELISVGWNDVPKFGGNLYTYNDFASNSGITDSRCMNYNDNKCYNDFYKKSLRDEIFDDLVEALEITSEENKKIVVKILNESKISNLIEFSRSIHAEMHAIIIGSQLAGNRIKGGKLFCTTYPCHNCARHIIVAGIKEIYYIEPYRKSLAIQLHHDAITETETDKNKVKLLAFEGVAPNLYYKLFKMIDDSRKVDGIKIIINNKDASPKQKTTLESIPVLESIVTRKLDQTDSELKELLS
ncbi:deoxycytidylate deaminase [Candidatus Peregrinibacteria bacterium]|nr:deoxycytidylate deaminase [Candidatus Peregrinibacteria bacterium]